MPQPAVKKRFERCRVKVLNTLLNNYKAVFPHKEPFHYHCYDMNGHKFIRIELDEIPAVLREQLSEIKKGMPLNTFIQIHLFEKHAQKASLIDL